MNSVIKKYIKSHLNKKSPIIVEIGAHYGEDTLDFLKIFPNPRIYCFEPDPRNIAVFRNHVTNKNVKLFEYAVSNKDNDEVNFYQSYQSNVSPRVLAKYSWINKKEYIKLKLNASGASSLKTGHPLVKNANIVKVKTIRIDTWAKSHKVDFIDFMWIDVQGAEKDVIKGFGNTVKIKYIWIECGETDYEDAMTKKQTIGVFSKIGYNIVKKMSSKNTKGNLLFVKN